MFRFKNRTQEQAEALKARLMTLPPVIDQIKSYEIGINIVESARAYDVVLISKFDDMESMQEYQVHPDHQAVLAYVREVTDSIVAADYYE
ncbi:MAG: Dabb family protein [Anaerolineae bacterium]|nr:Dabb family protein [Anaerolineae bacterium]